jgi:phosphoribosyl 1,2-cyclic phosphodiesterase
MASALLFRRRMQDERFTVRFWGVRGSLPTGGAPYAGVGGNTSCVEVRAGDELIILDAGSGLFPLADGLPRPVRATFLFSHFHWDHIQGFPFFRPFYEPGNSFVLFGPGEGPSGVEGALRRQMQAPNFPVSLDALRADLEFRSIRPGEVIRLGAARVECALLNHPQGCLGYRIECGGASVVYATDNEQLDGGRLNPDLIDLARNAGLLILDAQYTDAEYDGRCGPPRRGWGHSTVSEACRVAALAGVEQLALFHHDPSHSDDHLFEMLRQARRLFPQVVLACEGETWVLGTIEDQSRRRSEPTPFPYGLA